MNDRLEDLGAAGVVQELRSPILICRILCVGAVLTLGTVGAALADPVTMRCTLSLAKDPVGVERLFGPHTQPATKTFTIDGSKYYYVEKQLSGTTKSIGDQVYSLSEQLDSLPESIYKLSETINTATGKYAYSETFADMSDATHDDWEVSYAGSCAKVATVPIPAGK